MRAIGQALVLTPLSAITTAGHRAEDAGAASGLSNMLRNLGGAVGTAMLATVLTKREQFHSNIIGQSVTLDREEVRARIAGMTNYFLAHGVSDPAAAQHQAIVALGKIVKRQALVMGFSDTFAVIGVVLAIAAVALLFARKTKAGGRRARTDWGNVSPPDEKAQAAIAAVVKRVSARRSCSAGTKGGGRRSQIGAGQRDEEMGYVRARIVSRPEFLTATRPSCDARLCRS